MDKKMYSYLIFLFFSSLLIGFTMLMSNESHKLIALCIYTFFAAAMVCYHFAYRGKLGSSGKLLYFFLALALCTQYFDSTRFAGFSVWVLIFYAILFYGLRLKSPFIIIALVSHIALLVFHYRQIFEPGVMSDLSIVIVPRFIMMLLAVITQKTIMVNKENKLLTDSLRGKTSELEDALSQLSDYAAALESTADLRARNNLMHELHDELGHILTTASIGSQAATILLDQDVPAAKIRMELVTKQIQEAMKYLRQVISGESSDQNEMNMSLIQNLRRLIRETEKHTGIPIENNLEALSDEEFEALSPPKRTFLYNALMEGLTNGIRHACPNKFEFCLDMTDSQIQFSIWDDGVAPHDITYGYGLSKMASEAAGYGGTLDISNQDGFTMKITLPVSVGTEVS